MVSVVDIMKRFLFNGFRRWLFNGFHRGKERFFMVSVVAGNMCFNGFRR